MRDYTMSWGTFLGVGAGCLVLLLIQILVSQLVTGAGTVTWAGECQITGGSATGGISVECPHGEATETDQAAVRAFVDATVSGNPPTHLFCKRREFDGAAPSVTDCEAAP